MFAVCEKENELNMDERGKRDEPMLSFPRRREPITQRQMAQGYGLPPARERQGGMFVAVIIFDYFE
jgi:hypothetical protein